MYRRNLSCMFRFSVLLRTLSISLETSPLQHCSHFDRVCLDCDTIASCTPTESGSYSLEVMEKCSDAGIQRYACDNSYVPGRCLVSGRCICTTHDINNGCKMDPNDNRKLIKCYTNGTQDIQTCSEPGTIDLSSCSCNHAAAVKSLASYRSLQLCDYIGQEVCLSCHLVGKCGESSDGILRPVPIKNCSSNEVCQNHLQEAICQERSDDSLQCLHDSIASVSLNAELSSIIESSTNVGPPFQCEAEGTVTCSDCKTVSTCVASGPGLKWVPSASCLDDAICDNSVSLGSCVPIQDYHTSMCATKSLPSYCKAVGDVICASCTTLGICSINSDNGFTVIESSRCLGDRVCDNKLKPGFCQLEHDVPFSECLDPTTSSTTTESSTTTTTTEVPTSSPRPILFSESFCTMENDLVCSNCSTIGLCEESDDGFVVTPNAACFTDRYCDNTVSPGICLLQEEFETRSECFKDLTTTTIASTIPTEVTTILSPPDKGNYRSNEYDRNGFCEAPGDSVCYDCDSVGLCVEMEPGIFDIVQNSLCIGDTVCDNNAGPGTCQDPSSISTTCASPLIESPLQYCRAGYTNVCNDCRTVAKCEKQNEEFTLDLQENCLTGFICDNTAEVGVCLPAADNPTSSCSTTKMYRSFDTQSISQQSSHDLRYKYCQVDGEAVCFNCSVAGRCQYVEGAGFIVVPMSSCVPQTVCDNSIQLGECIAVRENSSSKCRLLRKGKSLSEPEKYDMNSTLHRTETQESTCVKSILLEENSNNCNNFLRCVDGHYTRGHCQRNDCFEEQTGKCSSRHIFRNTSECPQCGYKQDDDINSCDRFIKCDEGSSDIQFCPQNFCFDDAACRCLPSTN